MVDDEIPLHREWWFRIVVTLSLAALVHLLGKRRSSEDAARTSSRDVRPDERQERLLYSRLLAGDDEAHDLSLNVEENLQEDIVPKEEDARGSASPRGGNDTAEQIESTEPGRAKAEIEAPMDEQNHEYPKNGSACSPSPNQENDATKEIVFPPILSNEHPGLVAFWYYWDVSTSLFRIYTLARTDGTEVSPPYNPSSRRGVTPVALRVTNGMRDDLVVYWVDYKGMYIHKGTVHPNQTWYQSTWIDHPWVFCQADTDVAILFYIPYRVIPNTSQEPTVEPDEPEVGVHRFTIRPAQDPTFYCRVSDPVLPFPAQDFFLTAEIAVAWTLLHCHRMSFTMHIPWDTLIKYLTKILNHPDEPKYRKLRLSNPIFAPVWNSPLRALLLAVGFVEHHEYVYLGTGSDPLPRERVQDVAQLVYHLEQWKRYHEEDPLALTEQQQPEGADGFGREGFGRMGLNL